MSKKLRTLTALVVLALLGTGCRRAPAGTGMGTANTATQREQATKFAGCMRENGVRAFPDPDASGKLTIDGIANGSPSDTASATFKRAMGACKDLQPVGFTGGRRNHEQQETALEFARCIRDNGVKDFPDPVNGEPLVDTNRIPSSNRSGGMAILNAAMQKCRSFVEKAMGGQ
ncbi:hypothetical protein [Deinococcus hopiensis]|nr:hypothetical protein [Deinococcus hopiensis]